MGAGGVPRNRRLAARTAPQLARLFGVVAAAHVARAGGGTALRNGHGVDNDGECLFGQETSNRSIRRAVLGRGTMAVESD